jgi:predicted nucleic acid-binding protein
MALVDTSVWIDHFQSKNATLIRLLEAGDVECHPFVIGELACGNIVNRGNILRYLAALPSLPKAEDEEVMAFIDRHLLAGHGLGLIDIHLLASCALAGTPLWSHDKRLAQAAAKLGLDVGF